MADSSLESKGETPSVSLYALDPDFRKDPTTKRFCIVCQRDLKPDARVIRVRTLQSRDDIRLIESADGDSLIGSECSKKFRAAMETV